MIHLMERRYTRMTMTTVPTVHSLGEILTANQAIRSLPNSDENLQSFLHDIALQTEAELAEMQRQVERYQLSTLDYWTSRDLAKAEAGLLRCRQCTGYSNCQYDTGNKGFKPYITVIENGNRREIYVAAQECRYRLERKAQLRSNRLFDASNIPRIYAGQRLTNVDADTLTQSDFPAYKTALEFVKNLETGKSTTGLWISGPSGSGKTRLASLIGNELISRGKDVVYTTAAEIINKARHEREAYPEDLRRMQAAALTIVDDLAISTDYEATQLLLVIDRRQREGKGLIVTSRNQIAPAGEVRERLVNRLERMTRTQLK